MEQWGSGAPRMITACRDAGLPAPVWEELGFFVRVTLRTEKVAPALVDGRDSSILRVLESGDGRRTRDIAEIIGLSTRSTRTRLARLVERGLVREVGTGPNDPRRTYVRSAKDSSDFFRGFSRKR